MTDIEVESKSNQSPTMTKAVLCYHGYPIVHRISRKPHSYGRSVHSHAERLPDPT